MLRKTLLANQGFPLISETFDADINWKQLYGYRKTSIDRGVKEVESMERVDEAVRTRELTGAAKPASSRRVFHE